MKRLDRLKKHVLTLTCDRDSEFADDAAIEQGLKAAVYFADPHAPWQRARNENFRLSRDSCGSSTLMRAPVASRDYVASA